MGLITTMLRSRSVQASGDPNDERFWSHGFGNIASSGIVVNPTTAMRTSAVYGCVRLISESVGMLPFLVYQTVGESGRRRARNHPLWDLLTIQPNPWQTAVEFKSMMTGHVLLRGNAYAQIIPGPRGPVDQLVPLHPDLVEPEKIPNGLRYKVSQQDGSSKMLNQDQVLHLRGLSSDGVKGISVIEQARESFGLAIATEQFGARTFSQGPHFRGVLMSDQALSEANRQRLSAEWEEARYGLANAHRTPVLPKGLTWQSVGMSNEDAQFLQTREFQVEDICRWFGVPLHMISSLTKSTSWGSGIEQLSIGFVTYTLMSWLVRWEQAIARDLIVSPEKYFVEALVDMLLRGNTLDRYNAYSIAVGGNAPWMTRNEVRERENMSPLDGLDDVLQPLNMAIKSIKPAEGPDRGSSPSEPDDGQNDEPAAPGSRPGQPAQPDGSAAYLRLLVFQAAGRVIRKEQAVLAKAARTYASDPDGWGKAVDDFYRDHVEFVAETMQMPLALAQRYSTNRKIALAAEGLSALENASVDDLARMALGEGP